MSTNAVRGAALVAVAVLLGALVLGWGLDDPVPGLLGTTGSTATDVDTPAEVDVVATETPVVIVPPTVPPAPVLSPVHDPSAVSVQVANATDIDGLAGSFSNRLSSLNYVTRAATDAEARGESVIYYESGFDGDAAAILSDVFNSPNVRSELMPVPRPPVTAPDANGSNILIIVGSDDLSRS